MRVEDRIGPDKCQRVAKLTVSLQVIQVIAVSFAKILAFSRVEIASYPRPTQPHKSPVFYKIGSFRSEPQSRLSPDKIKSYVNSMPLPFTLNPRGAALPV